MAKSDVNEDVLSCSSEYEDSFISELFEEKTQKAPPPPEKVSTRETRASQNPTPIAKNRIIKGNTIKRKAQQPKSKPKIAKKGNASKSTDAEINSNVNIDQLKSQLGINTIMSNLESLTGMVQQGLNSSVINNSAASSLTVTTNNTAALRNSSSRSTHASAALGAPPVQPDRSVVLGPPPNNIEDNFVSGGFGANGLSGDNYFPYVEIPNYSPISSQYNHDFDIDDVLDGNGANPQAAFTEAFQQPPSELNSNAIANSVTNLSTGGNDHQNTENEEIWNFPQLDTQEKTGPKVGSALAKAVNAALTVRSDKDTISNLGKKYLRPDNVDYLCAPRCNKEIWNAVGNTAHAKDFSFQDIQKFMAQGLVPIVSIADQITKGKEALDPNHTKQLLGDAISLIGHSFHLISQRRRQSLRNYIHDRYSKICSSDVQVTTQLFGDNCLSKLKEFGDISKFPIGKYKIPRGGPHVRGNYGYKTNNYYTGGLNFKGPVPKSRGGQGFRGRYQRGQNQIPRRTPVPLMSLANQYPIPKQGRPRRQF